MDLYIIKQIFSLLTQSVPGLLIIVIIFSVLGLYIKPCRYIAIACSITLLALSSPVIKNLLVSTIEDDHFQLINAPVGTTHILVLNAGQRDGLDTPSISKLNPSSLIRLVEGVRLWRLIPSSILILTGDEPQNTGQHSQENVARDAAIWLGVNPEKIATIKNATNTAAEVEGASKLIGEGTVLVVSSAVHVPRAVRLLEERHIKAIPAPTHFMRADQRPWWKFGASNLLHADRVLHEHVGTMWASISYSLIDLKKRFYK